MAAISNYLENALLNHTLRGHTAGTSLSQPSTVYVALFTADPTDANTTSNEVAAGSNSYERQTVTFAAPSGGSVASDAQVDFIDMPGVTVTHVGLYDALTSGNLLYHGALTQSKVVNAGDTFTINAGDLTCTLD